MIPELVQEARPKVAAIDVQSEQESERGWAYAIRLRHEDGSHTDHRVTLAWADHEHWCGGRLAPSRVVEAVLGYVLEHRASAPEPGPLPASFDAARARRWFPEIDRELRESL